MMLNEVVRIGAPDGPLATVLYGDDSSIAIGYSGTLTAGTEIWSEDGSLLLFTVDSSAEGMGTLFESRTEQQVIDEDGPDGDYGWRFIHQGWLVEFEDGRVLFGDLAALNQNRQGVGTQGPTSTGGTNGSPLVLVQKVAITNSFTQVNGWKSSDTPESFVLNPNDVSQIDADYTYADAYVTWDGNTGVVDAPGSNGVGLVEYPANSTINVEVP